MEPSGQPDFVISGQRVNLRTLVESDLADYERWYSHDCKAWEFDAPYLSAPRPGEQQTADQGSAKVLENRRKWLAGDRRPPFKRLEIETNVHRHVGWVTIYRVMPNDVHMTEAGIDIIEDELWNQGLGTEAFRLWVDYVFEAHNLARLGAATWSGNPRMVRVAEKVGFQVEGRIRNGCEVKGRFHDRIKLGILRSEWEEAKRSKG
jgi:RimJ/RimL family protein N-acetyltransferase